MIKLCFKLFRLLLEYFTRIIGGLFLIALIAIACSYFNFKYNQSKDDVTQYKSDSLTKVKLLQGIWAVDESSNAVFSFHNDTVNYCTEVMNINVPYKYLISKDTLFLQYDGGFTKDLILKLNKDSLVLKTETGEIGHYYNRSSMREKDYNQK